MARKQHHRTSWIFTVALIFVLSWLELLAPCPVRADVAPPEYPQGANVVPGSETTQVRMQAEQVKMTVASLPITNDTRRGEAGRAAVEADFKMTNEGSADESMDVRFPLSVLNGFGDGWGNDPEIKDLLVWVNGTPVVTHRVETPNPYDATDQPLAWGAFTVSFPAGKTVPIRVTYTAQGIIWDANVQFTYILTTGKGWKGTIGKADLSVVLPYEANNLNVVTSFCTQGMQMDGKTLAWHFTDFEPKENLDVRIIQTGVWNAILEAKHKVQADPTDAEAWDRLGELYEWTTSEHNGYRTDEGGRSLHQHSIADYQTAISLRPKNALFHYDFASMLWYYNSWFTNIDPQPDLIDAGWKDRATQELKASLDLDPTNEDALGMARGIGILAEGFMWGGTPYPTDSPEPSDTSTPIASSTPTMRATVTSMPSFTPTAPSTQTAVPSQPGAQTGELAKKPGLPICGAGIILPLAILAGFRLLKRV
jgi:hypothetical protein